MSCPVLAPSTEKAYLQTIPRDAELSPEMRRLIREGPWVGSRTDLFSSWHAASCQPAVLRHNWGNADLHEFLSPFFYPWMSRISFLVFVLFQNVDAHITTYIYILPCISLASQIGPPWFGRICRALCERRALWHLFPPLWQHCARSLPTHGSMLLL